MEAGRGDIDRPETGGGDIDRPQIGPSEPSTVPSSEGRECPWCSAPVTEASATHCSACGAALRQSDSLLGVQIPGVTAVDPAMQQADDRSALQGAMRVQAGMGFGGVAPAAAVLRAAGIPVNPAMIGVAALAIDALTDALQQPQSAEDLGQPSAAALEAAARLDRGEAADSPPGEKTGESHPADPWQDLPPASLEDQLAGTEWDPWAPTTQAQEDAARPYDPWANQPDPWANQPDPWAAGESSNADSNTATQPGGSGARFNDPWNVDQGPWSSQPLERRPERPAEPPVERPVERRPEK